SDDGRKDDGNPREPHADAPTAGVSETLTESGQRATLTDPSGQRAEGSGQSVEEPLPHQSALFPLPSAEPLPSALSPSPFDEPALDPRFAPTPITPDTQLVPGRPDRLAQVREEVVAWLKTLVSAAVYALLIVTFGFQVARV